mmetsp:Transcript_25457/g.95946  ORF Transcript_25457/g.95946 Transcript_25457/m.95946 type:complete len:349 (-) Transcript_25457:1932-2978(-)
MSPLTRQSYGSHWMVTRGSGAAGLHCAGAPPPPPKSPESQCWTPPARDGSARASARRPPPDAGRGRLSAHRSAGPVFPLPSLRAVRGGLLARGPAGDEPGAEEGSSDAALARLTRESHQALPTMRQVLPSQMERITGRAGVVEAAACGAGRAAEAGRRPGSLLGPSTRTELAVEPLSAWLALLTLRGADAHEVASLVCEAKSAARRCAGGAVPVAASTSGSPPSPPPAALPLRPGALPSAATGSSSTPASATASPPASPRRALAACCRDGGMNGSIHRTSSTGDSPAKSCRYHAKSLERRTSPVQASTEKFWGTARNAATAVSRALSTEKGQYMRMAGQLRAPQLSAK